MRSPEPSIVSPHPAPASRQSVEFHCAPARQWGREPDVVRHRCAWTPGLRLRPDTALTLSVQTVPSGDEPLAVSRAGNLELFPACCATVAAGPLGHALAAAWERRLEEEHLVSSRSAPAGNGSAFFAAAPPGLPVAWQFRRIGPGHPDIPAGDPADAVAAFVATTGDTSGVEALFVFTGLEEDDDLAFAAAVADELSRRTPGLRVIVVAAWSPRRKKLPPRLPAVARPARPLLQHLLEHAAVVLTLPPVRCGQTARRCWDLTGFPDEPWLAAASEALTTLTAPLRFAGTDGPPASASQLCLAFQPGGESPGFPPVVQIECRPLAALTRARGPRIPASRVWEKLLALLPPPPVRGPVPPRAVVVALRAPHSPAGLPPLRCRRGQKPPLTICLDGGREPHTFSSGTVAWTDPALASHLRLFLLTGR